MTTPNNSIFDKLDSALEKLEMAIDRLIFERRQREHRASKNPSALLRPTYSKPYGPKFTKQGD